MIDEDVKQQDVADVLKTLGQDGDIYNDLKIIANYDATQEVNLRDFLKTPHLSKEDINPNTIDPNNIDPGKFNIRVETSPPKIVLTPKEGDGREISIDVTEDNPLVQEEIRKEQAVKDVMKVLGEVGLGLTGGVLLVTVAKTVVSEKEAEGQEAEQKKSVLTTLKEGIGEIEKFLSSTYNNVMSFFSESNLPWMADVSPAENVSPLALEDVQVVKSKGVGAGRRV